MSLFRAPLGNSNGQDAPPLLNPKPKPPTAFAAAAAAPSSSSSSAPSSSSSSSAASPYTPSPSLSSSASPMMGHTENLDSIEEMLRCFICMSSLKDAHMCPNCSKLACLDCVKKWVIEHKGCCPHCRVTLTLTQFIKCRWVTDLTQEISKIKHSKKRTQECSEHGLSRIYYCQTCSVSVCSDCAMFGQQHAGHGFRHIQTIYSEHLDSVNQELQLLQVRLSEATETKTQLDRFLDTIQKSFDEVENQTKEQLNQIKSRLKNQLKQRTLTVLSQRNEIESDLASLRASTEAIKKQIHDATPNEFITQVAEQVTNKIRSLMKRPLVRFTCDESLSVFPSEIVPPYETAEFKLCQFSTLQKSNQEKEFIVYSEPMNVNGMTWRLKVYPNGNGAACGKYLSVFLEHIKGIPNGTTTIEYRVEIVNQQSRPPIFREFSSDFEVGECWGYNRFFELEQLVPQGFLIPSDDFIVLRFSVRSPSYLLLSRDLQRIVQRMEGELSEARETEKSLREQLAQRVSASSVSSTSDDSDHLPASSTFITIPASEEKQNQKCDASAVPPAQAKIAAENDLDSIDYETEKTGDRDVSQPRRQGHTNEQSSSRSNEQAIDDIAAISNVDSNRNGESSGDAQRQQAEPEMPSLLELGLDDDDDEDDDDEDEDRNDEDRDDDEYNEEYDDYSDDDEYYNEDGYEENEESEDSYDEAYALGLVPPLIDDNDNNAEERHESRTSTENHRNLQSDGDDALPALTSDGEREEPSSTLVPRSASSQDAFLNMVEQHTKYGPSMDAILNLWNSSLLGPLAPASAPASSPTPDPMLFFSAAMNRPNSDPPQRNSSSNNNNSNNSGMPADPPQRTEGNKNGGS